MHTLYRCRILLLMILVCLVASAAKPHNVQTVRLPNVVIIFIDDMGYGDIGPFGAERATPQLDRMAKEGMTLTDFYVSSSACTPSRAALLTGAYADRIGMGKSVVFPADTRGLNRSEITIAEILKQGDYATGCFGKWHLGDQPEFMPLTQGFDVYEGIPYSNDMWVKGNPKHNFPPLPWIKQDKAVAHIPDHNSQARITDCITDATVDFIRANKDRPFFAYVPHAAVHAPHMVTPERFAAAKDDVMTALITEIDSSTGRILDTLRELGIASNSLVIFTNDNGGAGKTSSGPLRGAKFGPKYEGHMRVSTLAWWPGKIPAGSVSSEIGATIDLLPTIASFAGQPIPTDRIDGNDIGHVLLGKPGAKSPHDTLFYENDGIRQGKWKLVRYKIKADRFAELYDLEADLGETTNLADTHPDRVKAMTALLDAHVAEIAANVRPAAFVPNPKPLLASAGDLPTLAELKDAPIQPSPAAFAARGETLISTFEDGIGDWAKTGSAFDDGPRRNRIAGFLGKGYINSYINGDKPIGTLTSPPFKIERPHIKFLIGGGKHPGKTGLTFLVGDTVVRTATGNSRKNKKNEEVLDWKSWDVSEYIGQSARLRIIDQHSAGWGHTVVDHIVQADRGVAPPGKAEDGRQKAESGSPSSANPDDEWDTFGSYAKVGYDQVLRPQFHFSSRMGWLNDPNGMVYYEGEWHMLFQHYAKGNASGAKSWGNAVSTDLMHWQQLPHAINPYPKVDGSDGLHAIWSGSAVVDVHNALGKQQGDTKTLFALYSATHEKFFQGGAYSTDRGRTWTKINGGKPIIPHQEGYSKGQRDPRIFYFAPGKFYVTIMMIGGPERKVRLWKSTDLLNWDAFLDIPNKAAECIDMYQVGDKWVIADAGTHYEVGDFDGETWTGSGETHHFDYGDAYYAAQVFNQGPNGRVVHVGWLRSKQPGYRPFLEADMPFTQQMSIPAEITIRGDRLYRNPVAEIAKLYAKTHSFTDLTADSASQKFARLKPELIDLTLRFAPKGDMTLSLRGMPIHYKAKEQEFHFTNAARVAGEKAAWKKSGPYRDNGLRKIPAPTIDGAVTLRALVDRASLELFVNDGESAASFVVVPKTNNRELRIQAAPGLKIHSLIINELKSAWPVSAKPKAAPEKASAPAGSSAPRSRTFTVTGKNLLLPVIFRDNSLPKAEQDKRWQQVRLSVLADNGKTLLHKQVFDYPHDLQNVTYWGYLDMAEYVGKTITVSYDRPGRETILDRLKFSDEQGEYNEPVYTEKLRPQYHFTPKQGWNNDPNGLYYLDGLYHMSFQNGALNRGWGNIYWGHAVSKDLLHWEESSD